MCCGHDPSLGFTVTDATTSSPFSWPGFVHTAGCHMDRSWTPKSFVFPFGEMDVGQLGEGHEQANLQDTTRGLRCKNTGQGVGGPKFKP